MLGNTDSCFILWVFISTLVSLFRCCVDWWKGGFFPCSAPERIYRKAQRSCFLRVDIWCWVSRLRQKSACVCVCSEVALCRTVGLSSACWALEQDWRPAGTAGVLRPQDSPVWRIQGKQKALPGKPGYRSCKADPWGLWPAIKMTTGRAQKSPPWSRMALWPRGSSGLGPGAWRKRLPAEEEQTKPGPGDCTAVWGRLSRLGSIPA